MLLLTENDSRQHSGSAFAHRGQENTGAIFLRRTLVGRTMSSESFINARAQRFRNARRRAHNLCTDARIGFATCVRTICSVVDSVEVAEALSAY